MKQFGVKVELLVDISEIFLRRANVALTLSPVETSTSKLDCSDAI